jgi:hypothetical protein
MTWREETMSDRSWYPRPPSDWPDTTTARLAIWLDGMYRPTVIKPKAYKPKTLTEACIIEEAKAPLRAGGFFGLMMLDLDAYLSDDTLPDE